jgi:hypothetical protein
MSLSSESSRLSYVLLVGRDGMQILNTTYPFAVVDHHFRGSCVLLRVLREAVCWSCCGAFGGMFSWRPSSNPYPEPSRRHHRLHSLSALAPGVCNTTQYVSSGICVIGAMIRPSAVYVEPSIPSKDPSKINTSIVSLDAVVCITHGDTNDFGMPHDVPRCGGVAFTWSNIPSPRETGFILKLLVHEHQHHYGWLMRLWRS